MGCQTDHHRGASWAPARGQVLEDLKELKPFARYNGEVVGYFLASLLNSAIVIAISVIP